MSENDKVEVTLKPASNHEVRQEGATTAEKIALGIGAAAAIGVAAGLLIARQSAQAMRRYIIKDDSALKEYWQFDYVRDSVPHTRYFHGTEAAVQRRVKRIQGEFKQFQVLDQAQAEELAKANNTHIIELF
ncbi:MAG TPA: hypothetical protein P5309_10290 [Syntrophomonadaceae bacterium]|nr:hypothetical protein [Syntrophomonadaceae bacterium]